MLSRSGTGPAPGGSESGEEPDPRGVQSWWLSTYEQFSNSLKAAVYLELESVAFGYARTHREQIVQDIVKRIEPTLKSLGLEMFQFDLLEFCEVRSR